MPASALVTATEMPASRTAGTAWMWSQCPWVSTTWFTPRLLADLEQLLVLVGGVDEHGVAGAAAAQDVDVVVHRADHDLVDLGGRRRSRSAPAVPSPQRGTAGRHLVAPLPRSGRHAEQRPPPAGLPGEEAEEPRHELRLQ